MEYVYAALMLHRLQKEINEGNLKKVIESAGATADESKIKTLLASLKGIDIDKELEKAVVATPAAAVEKPAEKKKEEPKAEEAAQGLSALFG